MGVARCYLKAATMKYSHVASTRNKASFASRQPRFLVEGMLVSDHSMLRIKKYTPAANSRTSASALNCVPGFGGESPKSIRSDMPRRTSNPTPIETPMAIARPMRSARLLGRPRSRAPVRASPCRRASAQTFGPGGMGSISLRGTWRWWRWTAFCWGPRLWRSRAAPVFKLAQISQTSGSGASVGLAGSGIRHPQMEHR